MLVTASMTDRFLLWRRGTRKAEPRKSSRSGRAKQEMAWVRRIPHFPDGPGSVSGSPSRPSVFLGRLPGTAAACRRGDVDGAPAPRCGRRFARMQISAGQHDVIRSSLMVSSIPTAGFKCKHRPKPSLWDSPKTNGPRAQNRSEPTSVYWY